MSLDADSQGWIGAAIKSLAAAVSAAFAWVWHTSHRQARIEQEVKALKRSARRTERGVGLILNHMTGTKLHDIDGDDE